MRDLRWLILFSVGTFTTGSGNQMSDEVFKTPKAKKTVKLEESQPLSPIPSKRCRTAEDFFTFCNFILEYENYEAQKQEDHIWEGIKEIETHQVDDCTNAENQELRTKTSSPLGSTGSATESVKSESASSSTTSSEDRKGTDIESDEDSWDLVTCYCLKPFAGRPMIECSECLTWIHLSCAKIRKSNIPNEFTCQRCKDAKMTTRRSHRREQDRDRGSLSAAWLH